jgi:hypothetical protein
VDSANHDFHLQAGSPCRETGDNSAAGLLATDFEGDPRVFDADENGTATVDMGADEWLPPPDIDVSPFTYDFGDIIVGSASDPVDIIISNNGGSDLTVSDISLSDDTNYSLAGDTVATIAPGNNHTVTVTFAPTSTGVFDANLAIISNDPDSPSVDVLLSGQGVPVPEPDISVSPENYAFGDVVLGLSSTVIVTVENVGDADLTVSSIEWGFSDADYVITSAPDLPTVLPPTVDIEITFTPSAAGISGATLDITSDDPDEPLVQVQLSGVGVPICGCSMTPDTGTVSRGETLGFWVTLTNNTDDVQLVGFGTKATIPPDGNTVPSSPYRYLKGPYWVSLNPHDSTSGLLYQYIPPTAPVGHYVYHGYVGRAAIGVHECQFEFDVEP